MTDNEPTEENLANPNVTDHERRPVVNDQEPTGEQGVSSDRPGVDPGGYPSKPKLAEATSDEPVPEDDDFTA